MTEVFTPSVLPQRSARAAKCDRVVKLHVPEALHDDLAILARIDQRALSEYVRVVLDRHVYGTLGARRS
ncbi:MAG: hypothetical protein KDJ22_02335 [Candidatus Competibacteraceae bacterium]|nr:hypothetical protein [Candidatus Competibacteraceae bacterium]MCB1920481.1 hypothetical protein [Candidatus Competibacteraceae bacterium]MCP5124896.1 hypothetical protein [Gammaproteobacteria bacterium]HRX70996.1 hypothetical protein [Candidatus Competibacteraceae bacterium]